MEDTQDMEGRPDIWRAHIRAFMRKHGLKTATWSRNAGLSLSALRNFMNGDSTSLTTKTLDALAMAANVPVQALVPAPPGGTPETGSARRGPASSPERRKIFGNALEIASIAPEPLTRDQLARRTGIAVKRIDQLMEGEADPTLNELVTLTDTLQTTLDYLIHGHGERNKAGAHETQRAAANTLHDPAKGFTPKQD